MGEGGGACFPHYLGRRLLPDVCDCGVFRIALAVVCSEGVHVASSNDLFPGVSG